jgi:hypothetical protein
MLAAGFDKSLASYMGISKSLKKSQAIPAAIPTILLKRSRGNVFMSVRELMKLNKNN